MRRQKKVLRRGRYPLRPSKYANHLYDDRQHLILLVLRQHFRMPYRQLCETMEAVLLAFLDEAGVKELNVAVDSMGFSSTCASEYYTRVVERRAEGPGPPSKTYPIRRHVKETLAVETGKQLLLAVKFRLGPANDCPDFTRVLRKVERAGRRAVLVVWDKGYDSDGNHEYVREVLGGRSVIPIRRGDDPRLRVRGRYRREQWKHFDSVAYRQRVKAETVNSVQKRTMGSHVLSRRIGQQHRELVFRGQAYNLARVERLSLFLAGGSLHSPGMGSRQGLGGRGITHLLTLPSFTRTSSSFFPYTSVCARFPFSGSCSTLRGGISLTLPHLNWMTPLSAGFCARPRVSIGRGVFAPVGGHPAIMVLEDSEVEVAVAEEHFMDPEIKQIIVRNTLFLPHACLLVLGQPIQKSRIICGRVQSALHMKLPVVVAIEGSHFFSV